jgi:hypothetical protein
MLSLQYVDTLRAFSAPLVFGIQHLVREGDNMESPRYVAVEDVDSYVDADDDLDALLCRLGDAGEEENYAVWDCTDMDTAQLAAALVHGRVIRLRDGAAPPAPPRATPKRRAGVRQRVAHDQAMPLGQEK